MIVNAESGVVLVRAMPSELREVDNFLHAMQGVVARQVLLEAKIIEVQLSRQLRHRHQLGRIPHRWQQPRRRRRPAARHCAEPAGSAVHLHHASAPMASRCRTRCSPPIPHRPASLAAGTAVPGTIFGLAFQTSNFAALLNFLETQGELQVLSSPRIATINNQKAVLKVGTDEFFVTNVTTNQTTTTGGAVQNSPSITVQPFFSGIALDVTPQIDENNQIILHVHPSVSNGGRQDQGHRPGPRRHLPPAARLEHRERDRHHRARDQRQHRRHRRADEAVRLAHARTACRGWATCRSSATPSRTPIAAALKSELVILLKPTVIQSEDSWKQDVEDATQPHCAPMRHDEYGRYWKEEVRRQATATNAREDARASSEAHASHCRGR